MGPIRLYYHTGLLAPVSRTDAAHVDGDRPVYVLVRERHRIAVHYTGTVGTWARGDAVDPGTGERQPRTDLPAWPDGRPVVLVRRDCAWCTAEIEGCPVPLPAPLPGEPALILWQEEAPHAPIH